MAKFSTTEGQMYLVNTKDPQQKVNIQFFPAELASERKINSNDIDIIGRNNPLEHYTGGASTLPLTLDFYAEDGNLEDVMRRIKMIESWTYNDGYAQGRPLIKLVWGKLFKAQEVWVIKRFSYRLTQFDKLQGFLPRQAYVDIVLSLHTESNLKASDVRNVWV